MQFVRRSLLVLIGSAFPFLLFATAFSFGLLRVVGEPEPVKKILSDSGIYNSAVSSALEQAKTTSEGSSEVSLTDPLIKKAAEDSFSPQVVKDSSEKVIDGVYSWLDGKTTTPNFNVDLTSVKSSFADKVGQAAKEKTTGLPVCTSTPTATDPFAATCLPPGVTPAQVGEQAKQDVLAGKGFLEHPTITADSIKSSENSQSVFEGKLKDAPKQYQNFKKAPFILSILTLLIMLAIIFLSVTRRKGLRHLGIIMVLVGVVMLLFAWSLNRIVANNVVPKINLDNKVLQSSVHKLVTNIASSIDQNYWVFGGIYFTLGIVAIIAAMLIGKGGSKKVPATAADAENPPSTPKPTHKPPQKPKAPTKIQG